MNPVGLVDGKSLELSGPIDKATWANVWVRTNESQILRIFGTLGGGGVLSTPFEPVHFFEMNASEATVSATVKDAFDRWVLRRPRKTTRMGETIANGVAKLRSLLR